MRRAAVLLLGTLAGPAFAAADSGISLVDFQSVARQRMMRADADGDGKLSSSEWERAAEARATKRNPGRVFGLLDRNRDGVLDAGEIDRLTARRFSKLDANSDGTLTPDERAAARERPSG